MSRIHEALKKAEEEKALGLLKHESEEAERSSADPESPLSGAAAVAVAAMATMETAAGSPAPETTAGDQWSFPSLLESCVQAQWNPDPRATLFTGMQDGHGLGTEEFRTLRSRLYQIQQKQRLQKVLITSALPDEGKTFVAANLAQTIVRQHGRRVLLIDADLRWSRLHLSLGAPLSPGLAEYLAGEADEYAVIQRGPIERLFFIPGGKPRANPAELIANGRIKTLMQRLEAAFDWIIVDSPPTVPVADSLVLADSCDGVLLVVKAAVTPLEAALKARQELHGKRVLGVVLNGVDPGASYGSYYYGHYEQRGKRRKRGRSR